MGNEGKVVKVHYVGTFDDGTVFDSSIANDRPITFECMMGQMIEGFDEAVVDMVEGETKKVHIPAAKAYGERDEELVRRFPKAAIPDADELPVGEKIWLQGPNGQPFQVLVADVTDDEVVFDMNNEMAGKDLNFEITLLEILYD